MSNLFDEFDQAYDSSDSVEDVVARHIAPPSDDDDSEFQEINKRLSKARYYQGIVAEGVLEENGSADVAEINAEVRVWARQQMSKLVGRGVVRPVAEDFTKDQVVILKEIADRVLASKGGAPSPSHQVVVKKLSQAAPGDTPVTVRRQRQAPASAPPQKPRQAPQKKNSLPKLPDGKTDYDSIPTNEVFVEDGKRYKFVDNPNPPDDGSKPRVKLNVTNQVKSSSYVPMPSQEAQVMISATQAAAAISAGGTANTNFPDAGGGILRGLAAKIAMEE